MSNLDAGQNIERRPVEMQHAFFLWPPEELYMASPCKPTQLKEFQDVAFEATISSDPAGKSKEVWRWEFGVWGPEFGVWGSPFTVRCSPFAVQGLTPELLNS
jgi:hypothetical protein